MGIASLVTRGYGNGNLAGSIALVVTGGYSIDIQINIVGYLTGESSVFSSYTVNSDIRSALDCVSNISSAINTTSRTL